METPKLTEAHVIALRELYRSLALELKIITKTNPAWLYTRDDLDAVFLLISLHQAAESNA